MELLFVILLIVGLLAVAFSKGLWPFRDESDYL